VLELAALDEGIQQMHNVPPLLTSSHHRCCGGDTVRALDFSARFCSRGILIAL
jgi:hypothetical protein